MDLNGPLYCPQRLAERQGTLRVPEPTWRTSVIVLVSWQLRTWQVGMEEGWNAVTMETAAEELGTESQAHLIGETSWLLDQDICVKMQ